MRKKVLAALQKFTKPKREQIFSKEGKNDGKAEVHCLCIKIPAFILGYANTLP